MADELPEQQPSHRTPLGDIGEVSIARLWTLGPDRVSPVATLILGSAVPDERNPALPESVRSPQTGRPLALHAGRSPGSVMRASTNV